MLGTLTYITSDGETVSRSITAAPEGDELRLIVGGWIEIVPLFDEYGGKPCVVFCNEEGKLKDLPFNETASRLWWQCAGLHGDHLVGTVVIVSGDDELMEAL